jgi:ketosteroid isomerase-like protein
MAWRADVKAIETWVGNYTEAINSADIERILSYESDDICYYPANQPFFSGKENLRKWFISYFNYFSPTESFSFLDFKVYGDFAYVIGKYSLQGKIKQTGEEFKDNGKFTNFFKRQSDGNWICTQSLWNSDNRIFDIHSQILDDFSGTWLLDLSKSITAPGIISSKLVITQKGNNLNITMTNEIKDKNTEKSSFNYTIGSETQNILKSGIFSTTSTLSSGFQTFSINETLISKKNGTKQEYKRTTIYSLTAKGEILNIISDDILPKGSVIPPNKGHTEMIYTKF